MKQYLYEDLYLLEDTHWWHKAKRSAVLELIKRQSPKNPKILDMGCGTGKNLEALSFLGRAWGIDNTKEAISYCRKRGLQNVFLGDVQATKLPAGSFDIITLLDVLEHTDENKTLKEAYRLLKLHGIVIITVPAYQRLWSQWDVVLHHKRRYSKKSLTEVIKHNRFIVLKISYLFSFLVIPAYIIRFIKSRLKRKKYSSDFHINSKLVNWLLYNLSYVESFFVSNFSIPFGTSIICVAIKNEK